jgi:hypothetical protein
VVNPKLIQPNKYELYLLDSVLTGRDPSKKDSLNASAYWKLVNTTTGEVRYSTRDIRTANEQIFDDWGFSVNVKQVAYAGTKYTSGGSNFNLSENNGLIGFKFELTVSKLWYDGVQDVDGDNEQNWIRSGTYKSTANASWSDYDLNNSNPIDKDGDYEKIANGTWAPYRLCAHIQSFPTTDGDLQAAILPAFDAVSVNSNSHKLYNLPSVDIVFTSDKTKWTKCVVVETDPDMARITGFTSASPHLQARKHDSWKSPYDVNSDGTPKYTAETGSTPQGLSWFPGYAINLETGERLDIIFGEDSWLKGDNGDDMLWNPSSNMFGKTGEAKYGGRHYIYIMNHRYAYVNNPADDNADELVNSAAYYLNSLKSGNATVIRTVYDDAQWVNVPLALDILGNKLLSAADGIIPSEMKIKLRVSKPYAKFNTGLNTLAPNYPKYTFDMKGFAADTGSIEDAKTALDLINVVPNPYYAYSNYEVSQIDSRVKITNLPKRCTISIFSVDGSLIRQFKRDTDGETFQDWDLKNSANIPISSGLYLIHISAEGLGPKNNQAAQRVIKWFGVMRPVELNTF